MKKLEEIEIRSLEVEIRDGNFEEGFKRFKSLIQKEGILNTYKLRQRYEKPSEKKRRKKREAAERKFLAEHRERQMASGEWDKIQKRKEEKKIKKLNQQQNKHSEENE